MHYHPTDIAAAMPPRATQRYISWIKGHAARGIYVSAHTVEQHIEQHIPAVCHLKMPCFDLIRRGVNPRCIPAWHLHTGTDWDGLVCLRESEREPVSAAVPFESTPTLLQCAGARRWCRTTPLFCWPTRTQPGSAVFITPPPPPWWGGIQKALQGAKATDPNKTYASKKKALQPAGRARTGKVTEQRSRTL